MRRSLKTPDDKKTAKPKNAEKALKKEAVTFPASIRINDYGFLGLKKGLLEALGWNKGVRLQIDKNADGSATLRKVQS